MAEDKKPSGPDLSKGVPLTAFKDGKLLGHVGEDDVLLVQAGGEIFAIEPACSHYHGPLAEGLVVAIPSAAPGIMPASPCARVKPAVRRL